MSLLAACLLLACCRCQNIFLSLRHKEGCKTDLVNQLSDPTPNPTPIARGRRGLPQGLTRERRRRSQSDRCTLPALVRVRDSVEHHERLALPAEARLHQVRELRVAEGHVRRAVGLGDVRVRVRVSPNPNLGDEDVRQAREALVDVLRLLERRAHRARLGWGQG